MRVFARVVERSSFVRAAEDLALPASTATDAIKQLESRLGSSCFSGPPGMFA
jgi:DNA-binding transcriptional LysR family regulator